MIGRKLEILGSDYYLNSRIYINNDSLLNDVVLLFLSGWHPGKLPITTADYFAGFLCSHHKYTAITICLRGQGSPGEINTLTRNDFLNDVIVTYDYIKNKWSNKKIIVIGESFGSYIGSILTTKRDVHSLILRVPTDFPNEGFQDIPQINYAINKTREWKMQKHHYEESYALKAVHQFQNKVIIISSGKDTIIPFQTIKNYLSAKEENVIDWVEMKNSGHGLFKYREFKEYLEIIKKYI